MDGLSKEYNEIYLEIVTESIVRSLKSAHNAKSMKIKLTKKDTPCLTFEIELVNIPLFSCIHDNFKQCISFTVEYITLYKGSAKNVVHTKFQKTDSILCKMSALPQAPLSLRIFQKNLQFFATKSLDIRI